MRNTPRAMMGLVVLFAVISTVWSSGCNQKPIEPATSGSEVGSKIESAVSEVTSTSEESSAEVNSSIVSKSSGSNSSKTSVSVSSSKASTVSTATMSPFSTSTWKQKEFYLSGFTTGTDRVSLTAAKEVGLNLVEFAFSSPAGVDEAVKICDEIGLNCLPYDKNRWTAVGKVPLYSENLVYEWLTKLAPHKSVIGYYLWDEILTKDFEVFNKYKEVFEKFDPARLSYSILFPSYMYFDWGGDDTLAEDSNYYAYVDTYMKTVKPKVLSFDSYPLAVETNLEECNYWRDMGVMRIKSIEYKTPFWYYYQASKLGKKSDCTVPEMKFQMYAGLAYGTKALSAFNSSGRMYNVGGNGSKPSDFNEIQKNNREVMTVGRFLFNKLPDKIYHTGLRSELFESYFLDDINASNLIASAPDSLIISIFKDGSSSKQYMLVTNKSPYHKKTGTITLKSQKSIGVLNKSNGNIQSLGSSNSISLNLEGGDGVLYVIG